MLRAAVERQFEVIEATAQLARCDKALVAHIGEYRRIVASATFLSTATQTCV